MLMEDKILGIVAVILLILFVGSVIGITILKGIL